MKKIKITEKDLKLTPFEEIFRKASKSKEFRQTYKAEMLRIRLAKHIRELRIAHHLTQKAVAKRARMPQSVIARIESGDRGISVDTLGRLAHSFGKEVQLV